MKKILALMCSLSLILTPCMAYAVDEENENNETNINEVTKEENETEEVAEEETGDSEENETSPEVTTGNKDSSTENSEETQNEEEEQEITYTLESITVEGGKLTKDFDSDTFEYELEIDSEDLDGFNIVANPTFKSKKNSVGVIISKHDDYKTIKKNGITLVVSIDGKSDSTKTYKLKLKADEKSTVLSSVKMIGYAFNETFSSEVFDYTATIPNEVTAVTIEAVLANKDDEITVTKPSTSKIVKDNLNATITVSSLSIGGNKISFDVVNGDVKNTYTLYVTRADEDDLEEQETKILDSILIDEDESNIISNNTGKTITSSSSINVREDTNPDSIVSIIVVCFGCLVLLGIGVIGIYFFIKTSPKRMKKEIMKENSEVVSSPMIEVDKEDAKKETKIEINDDDKDVI